MHRVLAAFLGLAAFLAVAVYWLWQVVTGGPGLEAEEIAWRALLSAMAAGAAGLVLGRLGVALVSESLQEAGARRRDRAAIRAMGPGGEAKDAGSPRDVAAGERGAGIGSGV